MKQKFICVVIGLGGLLFGFIVVFLLVNIIMMLGYEIMDKDKEWSLWPAHLVPWLALAAGMVLGRLLSYWYSRRAGIVWKLGLGGRIAVWIYIALYLVTWLGGGPTIQTETTRLILEEWRKIHEVDDGHAVGLGEGLPSVSFDVAVPIVPFVVASRYTYGVGGFGGINGWDVQLWLGVRTKRLFFYTLWDSRERSIIPPR